jgi:hypothetical protein
MSLLDIVRSGVKIADEVTKSLQATVQYRRYIGSDAYGTILYDPDESLPGIPLLAIVDYKSTQVRTKDGILTVSRATVMLLDVNAVNAATGGLGIDNNDKFILPDGDTGPTLDIRGFVDAGTTHPVATEVVIG